MTRAAATKAAAGQAAAALAAGTHAVAGEAADPDRPRRLLEEVLARPEFHRSSGAASRWLQDLLDHLFGAAGEAPGWAGEVVTGAIVLAALVLVLRLVTERARSRRRRGAPEEIVADAGPQRAPARDLYRDARRAAQAGRVSEAVVLLFRAMVARLVERGLLLGDTSRTNREHLRDLRARPSEAKALGAVTPLFELVRYGRREAQPDDLARAMKHAGTLFPEEARGGAAGHLGPGSAESPA